MKNKFKLTTNDIATAGIFLAFILVFMLVPFDAFGVDMAFIPLIAVCLAATVKGFKMGMFTGVAFGVASLVGAVIRPKITTPIFLNPAVSILPRIIIPITVYFSFKLVKKLMRQKREDVSTAVASTVSTLIGVCTNTLLVLGMWALFYFGDTKTFGDKSVTFTGAFFAGVITTNFISELIICTAICPVICTALRIALGLDRKGPPIEEHAALSEGQDPFEQDEASIVDGEEISADAEQSDLEEKQ